MRVNDDGYELDRSLERLDVDRIEHWLAVESYWASGRPRSVIERSLSNSDVYGLYAPAGEQVGFFRVVTDNATFAWLCDVFIAKEHRGRGLAEWVVSAIRDDLHADGVYRIILATQDAHALYQKVGFTALAEPERMMVLLTPQSKS